MAQRKILLIFVVGILLAITRRSHLQSSGESVQLILTPNSSIDVEFGDTVDYICVGYGEHEPPNILWKFQEIDLMNSTLVGIYEDQVTMNGLTFTMSTLELCGVYLEASGVYSCTANNSMNSSTSFSFTLNVVVTKNTLATTVQFVSAEVQQSVNNPTDQSVENLTSIDTILSMVANLVSGSDVIITNNTVKDSAEIVNSLLQWNSSVISTYNNSSRIVESFESILLQYAQWIIPNTSDTFQMPLLTIRAENVVIEMVQQTGKSVVFYDDGTPGEEQVLDELSPLQNAAIRLSAPLFQTLNWNNSTSVGVVLGIYHRDNLFPVSGRENDASTTRQTQVCSSVLSATVGRNMAFDNLTQEELVTVLFRVQQKNDNNMYTYPGSETCVSWDFDKQNWTPRGCSTSIVNDGVIGCHCNHLTNFAVLVDVCSRQRDCQIICEAETNETESGKYNWPETLAGSVATITCPHSNNFNVSRNCSKEGEWLSFKETVCGVVVEQLIKLNDTFSNVCKILDST